MKVEIELPDLPDGDFEIFHGVPPDKNCLVLYQGQWERVHLTLSKPHIYAVPIPKWTPKIVTAGVLAPGWLVIDPDGTPWYSRIKPVWNENALAWDKIDSVRLRLKEAPSIAGRNAIWEIL